MQLEHPDPLPDRTIWACAAIREMKRNNPEIQKHYGKVIKPSHVSVAIYVYSSVLVGLSPYLDIAHTLKGGLTNLPLIQPERACFKTVSSSPAIL